MKRNKLEENNKKYNMNKKYILVSCGGANSEWKRFDKEFDNWKDCYDYVYNECKNERMYSEEIDSDGWVMWERQNYMLEIECWRDDIKLNENDIVIGIWGIGESDEVYEVVIGDSIDDKSYINKSIDYNIGDDKIVDKNGKEINVGSILLIKENDIEDGIVCGFDNGRVDVIELKDGYTIDSNEVEVVSELNG